MLAESEIQRKVLSKCSFFKDGAKFSELQIRDIDHDLYTYHLKQLVEKKLLVKDAGKYLLTHAGKCLVTNIDEIDVNMPSIFKVSVYLCPIRGNQILLTKRLKHPQFGYIGLVAEKKKYGEKIIDTAKRALKEETGLKGGEYEIIGNLHQIRKDINSKIIEDGVFYVCLVKDFAGELIEKSLEGEYFWVDLDQVKDLEKIFKPSLEVIVAEITKRLAANKSQEKFMYEFLPEV